MTKNILNNNISYAYSDKVLDPCPWGQRVYYYGCSREGGDTGWLKDNLKESEEKPEFHGVTALWTFDKKWGAIFSSPPNTIMLNTLPFFISAALSMALISYTVISLRVGFLMMPKPS